MVRFAADSPLVVLQPEVIPLICGRGLESNLISGFLTLYLIYILSSVIRALDVGYGLKSPEREGAGHGKDLLDKRRTITTPNVERM